MAFVKITEQPSLYDNLEKKSVLEILQDINTCLLYTSDAADE